jgi:serine phosphatase RsbU (regulator of sigma subunit)/CHASE2 domain-containing sensor protein
LNRTAVAALDARRTAYIRAAGAVVLIALAGLNWLEAPWASHLRAAWFDAYQALAPRHVQSMPATVVEIDEKSLAALGQWPWPRTLLAQLIDAVARQEPAAIGVDILMPEGDALSPERVLARTLHQDAAVVNVLRSLVSNDTELARAIAADHAILAVAGSAEVTGATLRAAPVSVRDSGAASGASQPVAPQLPQYAGAKTSLDELDRAAAGHGFISAEPAGGVIRRIPLVASIGGTLVPALSIEMLRVAVHAPSLRLVVSGSSVRSVAVGELVVPTEDDGAALVYYSPRDAGRFVSAVDVLQGKVDRARLQQKLVLIGVTGLGLIEYQNTPIGARMPGSEIHAQLLENLYDKTLLHRPASARAVEEGLLLALGALLIWATPRWKARHAGLLALACIALPIVCGFLVFRWQRLLFDAATPALGLMLLFGALLLLTLAETAREKRSLEQLVQTQREQSARIAGEMEAARRIQTATLPRDDLLHGDPRIDLAASMVPAREVGGDLYDFFPLDERRLFFLVGDVSGKGLSASIFMAVSKALYKSTTLRSPDAHIGELMSAANAEVSRDNPEMLFVTAFVGILDLDTGSLDYCNAGHENPYLLDSTGSILGRVEDGGGPPLCSVADFDYRGAHCVMRPGESLCMISDGVTDAQNAAGDFYGSKRVREVLLEQEGVAPAPGEVLKALRSDIEGFTAGAEAADDITILVLRWRGPRATA